MKIPNQHLVKAAETVMSENGMALERLPAKGRAMLYRMQDGKSVRLRTSNDHVLVVVADSPDVDAPVNVEGTDMLLAVMPEIERSPSRVVAFLVPSDIAARDAREGYREWLKNGPRTKGSNNTRTIWFDEDLSQASHGFMARWKQYQLNSDVRVDGELSIPEFPKSPTPSVPNASGETRPKLRDIVEDAKQKIADAAGVQPEDVHISIDMS